ncbi:hypothetical protein GIB67_003161 [Kingdonia uniflora]|uniref:Protein kinase domain-containing protein n=1 Tax=Kingdonia uniflora TaxID=39325 RepID=A0A7J7N635_9MAGN|nr:hypothetical protein GIB67_003161 [Kingdonia uniflora]
MLMWSLSLRLRLCVFFGMLVYGFIRLRVGFVVAFECSTGGRRMRVGYYIDDDSDEKKSGDDDSIKTNGDEDADTDGEKLCEAVGDLKFDSMIMASGKLGTYSKNTLPIKEMILTEMHYTRCDLELCLGTRSKNCGKQYAIKSFHMPHLLKLRIASSETAMTDVLHEVLIMKILGHPNIVNLIEVIDDHNTDHYYMGN